MLIKTFDSYAMARDEAKAYCTGGKRNSGMKGKEYRVYFYWGSYHLWSGYSYKDFPEVESGPVFSTRVK